MTTEIIILSKPILVKAGIVIPGFSARNKPIGYDIALKKQDQLIRSECSYFGRHQGGGMAFMEPQDPRIVNYLWNIALSNGDKPEIKTDPMKKFKAFLDNNGFEGNFVASTHAMNINLAQKCFKKDYPGYNLIVRE